MARTALDNEWKEMDAKVQKLEALAESIEESARANTEQTQSIRAQVKELKEITKDVKKLEEEVVDLEAQKDLFEGYVRNLPLRAKILPVEQQNKINAFIQDLTQWVQYDQAQFDFGYPNALNFARHACQLLDLLLIKKDQKFSKKEYDAICSELAELKKEMPNTTCGRVFAGMVSALVTVFAALFETLFYPIDACRGKEYSWTKGLANHCHRMFHSPLYPPVALIEEELSLCAVEEEQNKGEEQISMVI